MAALTAYFRKVWRVRSADSEAGRRAEELTRVLEALAKQATRHWTRLHRRAGVEDDLAFNLETIYVARLGQIAEILRAAAGKARGEMAPPEAM